MPSGIASNIVIAVRTPWDRQGAGTALSIHIGVFMARLFLFPFRANATRRYVACRLLAALHAARRAGVNRFTESYRVCTGWRN